MSASGPPDSLFVATPMRAPVWSNGRTPLPSYVNTYPLLFRGFGVGEVSENGTAPLVALRPAPILPVGECCRECTLGSTSRCGSTVKLSLTATEPEIDAGLATMP